jgi:hypothetical protein
MPYTKILSLIIFSGFIFQSCENLNDPGKMEFGNSVLLNLKTGDTTQQFLIYNTLPLSFQFKDPPPFNSVDDAFAENASITISDGSSIYNQFEINYTDSFKTLRCYTNSKELFIEPEKEYAIKIESNGEIITGNILTISDFEILEIISINGEEGNKNLDVSWSRCKGAKYYIIKTICYLWDSVITSYNNGEWVWELVNISQSNLQVIDPDTIINTDNNYSAEIRIPGRSDTVIVEIAGYDINTYNYYIRKIKKVGIENAYGYLGSSTIKRRKLYF